MFTGLIQAVGKVSLQVNSLKIEYPNLFGSINIGDSVAVDGVCLTVVHIDVEGHNFLADISEETLRRTTLGYKATMNGFVNLELALQLKDRLGGHLVTGHVDGFGKIISIKNLNNSWNVEVSWEDPEYGRYICEKGSICIDGISLTVAQFSDNGRRFSIAVIPHTWMATSLHHLSEGTLVNLEADIMAKYAERILSKSNIEVSSTPELNKSWLSAQGWI
tara:strand:- start:8517 stop:9173 length:657 start_codon:yes stop_codon:yes gene_type:complete